MKRNFKPSKHVTDSDAREKQAAFWMPLKIGLFVGVLFSTFIYPFWYWRHFFQNPQDLLQIAILKTADIALLIMIPVLAGFALGYLLYKNKANATQTLIALTLVWALNQSIIQIGENYTIIFLLIPTATMLVSTLIAKNSLNGFQT